MSQVDNHLPPPITTSEISTSLFSMRRGEAPGEGGIRVEVLQSLYPYIHHYLLGIFQASLDLSYFPKQWKCASIVVLRKPAKDDYTVPTSFRPISL